MSQYQQPRLPEVSAKAEILSFSGHETFAFRHGWLKKAVDATNEDPEIFTKDDAIVILGVGKNMVRSIRHWALATGIVEEEPRSRGASIRPTRLGQFLFGPGGQDQFIEDVNTLWLLHWTLISNPQRCTIWNWAFNMFPSNEFTREQLLHFTEEEIKRRSNKKLPSENSLKRDVDIFLRTYIPTKSSRGVVAEDTFDCPLTEIELIQEITGSDLYQMRRGPKNTLRDHIFVYALIDYWERTSQQETLAFSEAAYGKGSPGIVFKLDENSLADRLDRLEQITNGDLLYTETSGLKQIYRKNPRVKFEYLEEYYQQTNTLYAVGGGN